MNINANEMKGNDMRITTGIVVAIMALSALRGFSETQGRDWGPDVEGMNDLFEMSMCDVISRGGSDPYIEYDFYDHILSVPMPPPR